MVTAREAHQATKPGTATIGWKLDRGERDALLARFPPKYHETIADHVTLASRVASESILPDEQWGEIVGRSDDESGVEAMVVCVGGTTGRPDGSTYHITWSLEPGRHARESNEVIARFGWRAIDPPIRITLLPERLR
jgi:hypothetical protein